MGTITCVESLEAAVNYMLPAIHQTLKLSSVLHNVIVGYIQAYDNLGITLIPMLYYGFHKPAEYKTKPNGW